MPMNRAQLLSSVIDETRRLFHCLASVASQKAVVETPSRDGPQIARAKGVSRQHIQTIANGLTEEKLIETHDNPAHQRSPLLALTSEGTRRFQDVQKR